MARPTSKTPIQLAEEAELRAQRARDRAIKAETASNPLLKPLDDALAQASKDIAACSRKMTGPNSFENRLESIVRHHQFIEAEKDYTIEYDRNLRERKAYYNAELANVTRRIAKGENVTADEISDIVSNVPTADLDRLERALNEASNRWRSFISAKKATPAADSSDAPAMNQDPND